MWRRFWKVWWELGLERDSRAEYEFVDVSHIWVPLSRHIGCVAMLKICPLCGLVRGKSFCIALWFFKTWYSSKILWEIGWELHCSKYTCLQSIYAWNKRLEETTVVSVGTCWGRAGISDVVGGFVIAQMMPPAKGFIDGWGIRNHREVSKRTVERNFKHLKVELGVPNRCRGHRRTPLFLLCVRTACLPTMWEWTAGWCKEQVGCVHGMLLYMY